MESAASSIEELTILGNLHGSEVLKIVSDKPEKSWK